MDQMTSIQKSRIVQKVRASKNAELISLLK